MTPAVACAVLPEDPCSIAPLTVGDYLEQWLAHMRGRIRGSTYDGYAGLVRNHAVPRLGSIPLSELRPLDVQGCYSAMLCDPRACSKGPVSAKTVGNLHRVLRKALSQAVRWELVGTNAAACAEPPRAPAAELAVLDVASATVILDASAGTRMQAPVALALATGMRRGEILGLRWGDLDEAYTVARVCRSLVITTSGLGFSPPKTPRSRRAVALPCFAAGHLATQREHQARRRDVLGDSWKEHSLVVDSGDGSPWNPDTFSRAWGEHLKRKGIPHVRFHDLRHAHATFMLLQGVHPKIVSERLGHSSVGITLDTYSHVLPSMQAEAVRAFDALFPKAGVRGAVA